MDECDKLFEVGKQGFRDQLAVIYKACESALVKRALFSATFSHDVEEWCNLNFESPVTVSIGTKLVDKYMFFFHLYFLFLVPEHP